MSAGIIPRLAVRLRSAFPDATLTLGNNECLTLKLATPQARTIDIKASATPSAGPSSETEPFQIIESSLLLRFESLDRVPEHDILRLLAAENAGLRGVSVVTDDHRGHRALRVRASFLGVKGRTKDEAENLLIDVLSVVRFSRLLEDRIMRSTAAGAFCFEMYHSQYWSKSGGRNRYVNYARSVFQGSAERLMGEACRVLKADHGFDVRTSGVSQATLTRPSNDLQVQLRVPEEIPMLVLSSRLPIDPMDAHRAHALADRLNRETPLGHFEVTSTAPRMACAISFVAWKHMTNDLRLYAVDHLISTLFRASELTSTDRTSAVVTEESPLASWIRAA